MTLEDFSENKRLEKSKLLQNMHISYLYNYIAHTQFTCKLF